MSLLRDPIAPLSREEQLFYRDKLRAARYAALADAEGFIEVCFAVEALGLRLSGQQSTLGGCYADKIHALADSLSQRDLLAAEQPGCFTRFDALYFSLKKARNDVMHSGAYARHATGVAIELCIHLEEALMSGGQIPTKASDYMVRDVVLVKKWQPIAHARQLMLTHSFSFLPVFLNNEWKLISELSIAKFLPLSLTRPQRELRLAKSIDKAQSEGLDLISTSLVFADSDVTTLLCNHDPKEPAIWLVADTDDIEKHGSLQGVLTPFELM